MNELRYFFRVPKYPLFLLSENRMYGVPDESYFMANYEKFALTQNENVVIDSGNEGWVFYVDKFIFSPLTLKKRYTKKEIITLFNNRETPNRRTQYFLKSLDSKRFDKIFSDILNCLLDEQCFSE